MLFKDIKLPCNTVAAVNGFAIGGGFEIAMSADFLLASENAVFRLPEIGLGLLPIWAGLNILPRLVGTRVAKEIIILGKKFGVEKAKEFGLINEVFPQENFMEHVMKYVKELKKKDATLVQLAKHVINRSWDYPMSKTSDLTGEMFDVYASKDKKEKIKAFRKDYFP